MHLHYVVLQYIPKKNLRVMKEKTLVQRKLKLIIQSHINRQIAPHELFLPSICVSPILLTQNLFVKGRRSKHKDIE